MIHPYFSKFALSMGDFITSCTHPPRERTPKGDRSQPYTCSCPLCWDNEQENEGLEQLFITPKGIVRRDHYLKLWQTRLK